MALHTLFIFFGPTGAGKTALSQLLLARLPSLKRVRSCTSRPRRVNKGEQEDAYHFLSREEFLAQEAAGCFVEYDEFGGHLYGRRFEDFNVLKDGPCFADMTESGVAKLQAHPELFRVKCIKITPLNKTVTERDAERAVDDAARARIMIHVDHEIVNDHGVVHGLEAAYCELHAIIDETLYPEG